MRFLIFQPSNPIIVKIVDAPKSELGELRDVLVGSLGLTTLRGPSSINLDMNMVKRFPIHESTNFEFRLDVINILNHPNFGDPITNIDATGSNGFGRITSATGARTFVFNTRVNF